MLQDHVYKTMQAAGCNGETVPDTKTLSVFNSYFLACSAAVLSHYTMSGSTLTHQPTQSSMLLWVIHTRTHYRTKHSHLTSAIKISQLLTFSDATNTTQVIVVDWRDSGCYLQCFDTVGWTSGRASGLLKIEWWGAGMVICLQRNANDLHMVQLMPLPDHYL